MRYCIYFNKTINQFVPYYIGGRKLILYLQSLMRPLQILNTQFVEWAKETRIEAAMTSQVFKFEWFLNHKFKKYFIDSRSSISIKNGVRLGVPLYWESANIDQVENWEMRYEKEDKRKDPPLYFYNEKTDESSHSFIVYSPQIDTSLISTEAYLAMMSYYIDKYRLAGKTYKIKFHA